MKNLFPPVFFITFVVVLTGLWVINPSETTPSYFEYIYIGLILLLFTIGIISGYRRMKMVKDGTPAGDERSKGIVMKTGAWSFYLSLLSWILLIFIYTHESITETFMLLAGVASMAIIYVVTLLIVSTGGVRIEKQDQGVQGEE